MSAADNGIAENLNGEAAPAARPQKRRSGRARGMRLRLLCRGLRPLLVTVDEAALLLGIPKPTLYDREKDGLIGPEPVTIGSKVKLYRFAELEAWTEAGCPDRVTWRDIRADRLSRKKPR